MTSPVCPLCGSQEHEFCFFDNGHQFLACRNCELFFIHPYPEEGVAHQRVSDAKADQCGLADADSHYRASRPYCDRYFPLVEQECGDARSVLDVGCGTGRLLERLAEKPGLHRVGIELNADRAEFARRVARCEVYQVPLEQFEYPARFDVITMINVLSHIPRFDCLFASIRSLLTDRGRLILKTGEIERGVRKGAVSDWGIPDHLHVLGMNTIRFAARKYGFHVVRHESQPLSASLFSRDRLTAPARGAGARIVKGIAAMAPFALPIVRAFYDAWYGAKMHSSFIVMSPAAINRPHCLDQSTSGVT